MLPVLPALSCRRRLIIQSRLKVDGSVDRPLSAPYPLKCLPAYGCLCGLEVSVCLCVLTHSLLHLVLEVAGAVDRLLVCLPPLEVRACTRHSGSAVGQSVGGWFVSWWVVG